MSLQRYFLVLVCLVFSAGSLYYICAYRSVGKILDALSEGDSALVRERLDAAATDGELILSVLVPMEGTPDVVGRYDRAKETIEFDGFSSMTAMISDEIVLKFRWSLDGWKLAGLGDVAEGISEDRADTNLWMRHITKALDWFGRRHGRMPNRLTELVDEGFIPDNELTDGWGNAWVYEVSDDGDATVGSLGADGRRGGKGDDEDVFQSVTK
jgi:hypothetical protein